MSKKRKTKRAKPAGTFQWTSTTFLVCGLIFLLFGILLGFRMGSIHEIEQAKVYHSEMTKLPSNLQPQLTSAATNSATLKVPILMYHYVEYVKDTKDTIRQSLNIIPATFEAQLMTLKNDGYTFITTSELSEAVNNQRILPPKPIVITFDDGYRDFYTDVFPILQKNKVKAVAYIIPGLLEDPNYLTKSQLKEISKSKFIEIGAHTVSHPYLKGMRKHEAEVEISESKKMLEQMLGIKVVSFAYPYGAFDEQAIKLVEKAGFTNAVSTIEGFEANQGNKYFMYRVRPGTRTGEELLGYLKKNTEITPTFK